MIVFGSFCVHFVADGVLFSFGILMHTIKDDLKLELHTVGIIASLFVSLPLLLAPVSGALVNKIGCRAMTMFGGFFCSVGLVFASWMGDFLGALIGIGIVCGKNKTFEIECSSRVNRNGSFVRLRACGRHCCALFR
jgi:MFS family permease